MGYWLDLKHGVCRGIKKDVQCKCGKRYWAVVIDDKRASAYQRDDVALTIKCRCGNEVEGIEVMEANKYEQLLRGLLRGKSQYIKKWIVRGGLDSTKKVVHNKESKI